MERNIRGTEARAVAAIEVGDEGYDAQFRELDQDLDIEAELAALKAGSGSPAELTAGDGSPSAAQAGETASDSDNR